MNLVSYFRSFWALNFELKNVRNFAIFTMAGNFFFWLILIIGNVSFGSDFNITQCRKLSFREYFNQIWYFFSQVKKKSFVTESVWLVTFLAFFRARITLVMVVVAG